MTDSTTVAPAPRTEPGAADGSGAGGSGRDSLTVTDNRTGQTYELEITDGTIRAADLKQISADGPGLATYDPGFVNTASMPQRRHLHRRRRRDPRVPRLPDRAAGRAVDVPRGGRTSS